MSFWNRLPAWIICALFGGAALLTFTPGTKAQSTVGIPRFGTYEGTVDTINVGSLQVMIAIPLYHMHNRGSGMDEQVSLVYTSVLTGVQNKPGMQTFPSLGINYLLALQSPNWSIQSGSGLGAHVVARFSSAKCGVGANNSPLFKSTYNYTFYDARGLTHTFPTASTTTACGKTAFSSVSNIAADDGIVLKSANGASVDVVDATGVQYKSAIGGPATFVDTNGNQLPYIQNTIPECGYITDPTTGPPTLASVGNNPVISGGCPNAAGVLQPAVVSYLDTTGSVQQISISYKNYTVAFDGSFDEVYENPSDEGNFLSYVVPLVDSISYPDGSSYSFAYESDPDGYYSGRISKLTLPGGGTIQYTYSPTDHTDGSIDSLTRTTQDGTTTYSRQVTSLDSGSGVLASTTTITYPDKHQEVATFTHTSTTDGTEDLSSAETGYFQTSRTAYSGNVGSTVVQSSTLCYNGATGSCTSQTLALPITKIAKTLTPASGLTSQSVETFNANGFITEVDSYDYNASTPIEKTITSYASLGNNILNRPSSVIAYNGSGAVTSESTYAYDEYSLAASGVSGLATVTGARGNLTTVTRFSSSSSSLPAHTHYDNAGQMTSTVDANNGITTYSYDSTDTYITGKIYPAVAGGTFSETYSVDPNTGLPTSAIDINGNKTTYSYDTMLHLSEVKYPDGGSTQWVYGVNPPTVTKTVAQTSSVSAVSETSYDGYGRAKRTIVANGQSTNPWYQKDTCYDSSGRTAFASYSYQGAGIAESAVCSGNGDTYKYDVLGRLVSVTRSNGEAITYTYQGRATQVTNENGVQRISQVDALGRPTIVCEISSNASMPGSGSPASCGTDIAGTGFTTTYAYNLATHTTTIAQGAQSRAFQADWLGRTISTTEPEISTTQPTTYSYAFNSTGLVKTRKRPKANQSTATVLTTTTMQYDALGRVIGVSYDDGTPARTFLFDKSAGWADVSQVNLKGRLSSAAVAGATTVYNYDTMGRTTALGECLPSGCGTASMNKLIGYTYDLAGNLKTSSDGAGVTTTYTVTPANEVQSLTSTLGNTENPTKIIAGTQFGPSGPESYTFGNGLSAVLGYDTLGRESGGWVCSGSTAASCAGGTELYGFSVGWKGTQVKQASDTSLKQTSTYSYDEFNRLSAQTVTAGTAQNFTYTYDRYGNRWDQTVTKGTGPAPELSFNTATNQINTSGYKYDAAGNLTNDGAHSYTYDAVGNITAVDAGSTATYVYDALNHRVRTVVGSATTEFVFNANGQRVSVWNPTAGTQLRGQYYWGKKPVAYYESGAAHFQHQNWVGTERARTTYSGSLEGMFISLPFGDGQATASGTDGDPYHFSGMDMDTESGTSHAQSRQYSSAEGRWMRPDPFAGSYDYLNPQSLNRYLYSLNNPLGLLDSSGLACIYADKDGHAYADNSEDGDDNEEADCEASGGGYVDGVVMPWDIVQTGTNVILGNQYANIFTVDGQDFGVDLGPVNSIVETISVAASDPAFQMLLHEDAVGAIEAAPFIAPEALEVLPLAGFAIDAGVEGAAVTEAATESAALDAETASTFSGGQYTTTTLDEDMLAYRYSGPNVDGGNPAYPAGRYLTDFDTVAQIGSNPTSPSTVLNLPSGSTAANLNTFIIPAGTTIYTGGIEGGADFALQIYIKDYNVLIPY